MALKDFMSAPEEDVSISYPSLFARSVNAIWKNDQHEARVVNY